MQSIRVKLLATIIPPGMPMPGSGPVDPTVPQVAEFVRYGGWPEIKEAIMTGRLKAAMH